MLPFAPPPQDFQLKAIKRILLEVIGRAVEDACGYRVNTDYDGARERVRREAIHWLMRDDGFVEICGLIGLDADYLRRNLDQRLRALKQWREAQRMPEISRQDYLQAIAAD